MERAEVAGSGGAILGLSSSGPFFPPGTIVIGLLVGVALGGTHSGLLCMANPLGCSPPNVLASVGKSLRRDCSSVLSELSSSAWVGAGELLGG